MCFSVKVDINLKKLAAEYKALLSPKFGQDQIQRRVQGYLKTDILPVLFSHEGQLRIEPMSWSLAPKWADHYPPKWSTYNARMEREGKMGKQCIYEVPSFREPFSKNKFCLIPIAAATEACYWGETSGKIINFGNKNHKSFLAAGLYESWIDKQNGEIKNTCTLITDNPYPYLFEHGHDRSIILLDQNKHHDFLNNKNRAPEDSFEFIRKNRVDQDWDYEVEREVSAASIKKNTPTEQEMDQLRKSVWQPAS